MIDGQPRLKSQRGGRVDPSLVKRVPSIRRTNASGFERLPYILAGIDGKTLLKTGDQVDVKVALTPGISSFNKFQSGQRYLDPMTGGLIGLEAQNAGTVSKPSANTRGPAHA